MLQVGKTCLLLGTLILSFTFPSWSQAFTDARPQVVVSVYNDAGVPATVLAQAERQAARIFDRAGVEVIWANCSLPEATAGDTGGCEKFDWPAYLALRITTRSPHTMNEVFGVAFLSDQGTGCYSNVFYDRALELHADWKVGLADILGSVAAHELGHLLLGSNAHAPWGIMRAQWQGGELRRLAMGDLRFTPEQAGHMRGKLIAARAVDATRLAASARSAFQQVAEKRSQISPAAR